MSFHRESVRHPLAVRRVTVARVTPLAPSMRRITLTGPELAGFSALGPADHVKLFFPDPSGALAVPDLGPEGMQRPAAGMIISRDYTPLAFRADALELDIDFVLHGGDGPASAWAAQASPGDALGVGGPRGSRLAPADLGRLLLIADETALPASRRWLELVPAEVPVTGIFEVADDELETYLDDTRVEAEWLRREDAELDEAVRSLGPIADDAFVFLAGEATTLAPLRRYLRRELGLPAEQVSASGYWKRGIVNLDHHAPLDPSDPD